MRGLYMLAKCPECGHDWQLGKPLGEYEDGPRCGECGNRDPEIIESPLGFDPDEAVGGGTDDSQTEQLREALRATPGIGESAVDYVTYWFRESVEGPEDLNDLLLEISGVDTSVARRVVTSIYGEGDGDDAPAPFAVGGGADGDTDDGTDDGTDTLDAIIRAKKAGLIDSDDDSGVNSAELAEAIAEAINPAIQRMAQAQAALAEGDGEGEVEALRREVEQLREEREKSEIQRLEEKIEELEANDPDSEIRRLKETRSMLENAPEVSAEAADSWGEVAHGLLSRLADMQKRRELLDFSEADDRKPGYEPAPPQRGQPAPAQAPRPRPAPGAEATADGGTAPGGGRPPAGGDGDDRNSSDGEPTDPEKAEKSRKIRENLGIAEGGDDS